MRVFTFTLVLLVAVALGSIGCGEDEKNDVKPEEPVVEEPVALSDEEARKKAKAIVESFSREHKRLVDEALKKDDFSTLEEDIEKVLLAMTGFGNSLVSTLGVIHKRENPEEVERLYANGRATPSDGLMFEYLRLSFMHPEKSEEELLELFRLSARAGNTTMDREKIAEFLDLSW